MELVRRLLRNRCDIRLFLPKIRKKLYGGKGASQSGGIRGGWGVGYHLSRRNLVFQRVVAGVDVCFWGGIRAKRSKTFQPILSSSGFSKIR